LDIGGFGAMASGPLTKKSSWIVSGRRSIYDLMLKMRGKNYSPRTTDRFNIRHRLIFGGQIKWVNTSYEKWSKGDTLITGIVQPAYSIPFGPLTSYKSAAYFHHYYSPISWLKLNAGVRFDYFNFIRDLSINPRLGMQVKISEKLNITASYGLYSQFPPFYKIFLDSRNSGLETSKSTHIIIGTEYLLTKDMQIKIEGFYKDLKNLPYSLTDTSKFFTGSGTGNAKGVELTLTKKLSRELYILVNYTYCKSVRKENKNSQEYEFDYDSPYIFNLMSSCKLGKWWDFSFTCRYSTGLPYTPYDLTTRNQINGKWFCEKGEKNSERLPDYFRMGIRTDRRFIFKDFNISAFEEVWNLTNHENIMSYEYSEDFLDKEPVTLFSIMPMIGLNFEF
jgi:outer membrane receptor protein involved in Fe transport